MLIIETVCLFINTTHMTFILLKRLQSAVGTSTSTIFWVIFILISPDQEHTVTNMQLNPGAGVLL